MRGILDNYSQLHFSESDLFVSQSPMFESFIVLRITNDASEEIKCLQRFFGQPNDRNNTLTFPENRSKVDIFGGLIMK